MLRKREKRNSRTPFLNKTMGYTTCAREKNKEKGKNQGNLVSSDMLLSYPEPESGGSPVFMTFTTWTSCSCADLGRSGAGGSEEAACGDDAAVDGGDGYEAVGFVSS
jgi:hypothetical protein